MAFGAGSYPEPPDPGEHRDCLDCQGSGKVCSWCELASTECECKLTRDQIQEDGLNRHDFIARIVSCYPCEGSGEAPPPEPDTD